MLVHRARPETEQLKARATKSPVGSKSTVPASDVHVANAISRVEGADMMCFFLFCFFDLKNEKTKFVFLSFYTFSATIGSNSFCSPTTANGATASLPKKETAQC